MNELPILQSPPPLMLPVDDVVPAAKPIWSEPYRDHVLKRFRRKVLLLAEEEKVVTNALCGEMLGWRPALKEQFWTLEHAVNRCHPLIDAVGTAFSHHRPLTLSPDAIWMVIEQGFSHHVNEYAESLRGRLVRHTGSEQLVAEVSDVGLRGLEVAVESFSSQIRERTNAVLYEALRCDFSTTTPVVRVASDIVLMDCFSSYFTYSMMCVCGIPSITLTGTLADWERIRSRVEVFESFGLEWWVARLRPILDEFVRTIEGRPSVEFWRAIYKPQEAYGARVVTGWIADLFPYLNDPPQRRKNHVFDHAREDWVIPIKRGVATGTGYSAALGHQPWRWGSELSVGIVKLLASRLPSHSSGSRSKSFRFGRWLSCRRAGLANDVALAGHRLGVDGASAGEACACLGGLCLMASGGRIGVRAGAGRQPEPQRVVGALADGDDDAGGTG